MVSPSTVGRYQKMRIPAPVMSRLLGLEVVVEGRVQDWGAQVRIAVRLTDLHSGKVIWANTYDGRSEDLLALENKVASGASEAIRSRLAANR